ncbi:hypothetical protein F4861DRAFT_504853 [Xylaria intraflava]|nr:hypothetical protein F4861DRAFT_504853 [Xylaria intraflava]
MLAIRLLPRRATSFQRTPTRAPRALPSPLKPSFQIRSRRFQSSKPEPPDPNPGPTAQATRVSRILTATSRFLPKRLQTSLQNLRSAPFSHICAFLVLHELTAIVPVLGLTCAFYFLDWTPLNAIPGLKEKLDAAGPKAPVGSKTKEEEAGAGGDEEYTGRAKPVPQAELTAFPKEDTDAATGDSTSTAMVDPTLGEDPAKGELTAKLKKMAAQLPLAYGITKLLLVPRIALSLWLTPWLARSFVIFRQGLRSKRS